MARPVLLLLVLAILAGQCASKPRSRRQAESYVTYIEGDGLPIVLSAPHGGSLEPSSIPTRDSGCWEGGACVWSHTCENKDDDRCKATTTKDLYTYELTMELREALCNLMGACPHVILNELHRRKFDANRDKAEATFGVPVVEEAFDLYHDYIEVAKSAAQGMGIFFDIHGHGHSLQRAELGYLISGSDLDSGNLNADSSSIKNLAGAVGISFEELLRGLNSFGGYLQAENFDSVPGTSYPGPEGNSYFSGGYNTRVHGSRDQGIIDAIQIESARSHREMPTRTAYVAALASSMKQYLESHYPNWRRDSQENNDDSDGDDVMELTEEQDDGEDRYDDDEHYDDRTSTSAHNGANALENPMAAILSKLSSLY